MSLTAQFFEIQFTKTTKETQRYTKEMQKASAMKLGDIDFVST